MAERTFSMTRAHKNHLDGLETKSAKIRFLNELGCPRADIARHLGIVYQHVKNVLDGSSKGGKSKTPLRIIITD